MERVLPRHEIVVRDLDGDEGRDELVELSQLPQVVLPFDRGGVVGVHTCDEAAERRDPVALADPENARVDVCRATFEDAVRVRDRASGVVVSVELDVAVHVMTQLGRERVALPWRRDAGRVRDSYS